MTSGVTHPRSSSRYGTTVVPLSFALLLAVAVYHRALGTFFAQDDITFLTRAAGLEPPNWLFRPLSVLSFRLEYRFFALEPWGYHLVNLGLHLANVTGVYALALRLGLRTTGALSAAVVFGVSSIAFTPLYWASGVGELMSCALLLAATLMHLHSRGRLGWRWGAALVALAAMFAKETAVAWVLVVLWLEWKPSRRSPDLRAALPAGVASLLFLVIFVATRQTEVLDASEPYARSASPLFLLTNLFTYVHWCVARWVSVPDVVAAADGNAWRLALPVLLAAGFVVRRRPRRPDDPVWLGLGWWIAFLLPVLSLTHHTYLYYLYVPWAGGSLAAVALVRDLLERWPTRLATALGAAALSAFVLAELHNIDVRASATRGGLPVDRTLREATLLRHALPALQGMALPSGTPIAFVNPAPGARFDLMTGLPTRDEDALHRRSYFPLEAALRGGQTLRLFVPGLRYLGFSRTIPPAWENAEWFYFEQRGWLKSWGRGQEALLHQAETQLAAEQWAAAESTYRRVRALGDTLPAAVAGERLARLAVARNPPLVQIPAP